MTLPAPCPLPHAPCLAPAPSWCARCLPLGTRSPRWHTAGWCQCCTCSGCDRWPSSSALWWPRSASWQLLLAGGSDGETLSVSTPGQKNSTQQNKGHSGRWQITWQKCRLARPGGVLGSWPLLCLAVLTWPWTPALEVKALRPELYISFLLNPL